jgi:putative oxidoreductase
MGSWRTNLALFLMRAMLGVVFMGHGSMKLFGAFGGDGMASFTRTLAKLDIPYPEVAAWLAAGTEFLGGLALILGLGVRWVCWPLVFTMLVASFKAHPGAFFLHRGGMEFSLTLACMTAALGLLGPGAWSVKR